MPVRILFILISLLFYACDHKKELIEDQLVDVELISPKNIITNHNDIEFVWESNMEGRHRFFIAADSFFQDPIIDTLIELNNQSFILGNSLAPKGEFYWKVAIDSIEAVAKFNTIDLISQFEGIYQMSVHYTYEDDDGFINIDTTYDSTLELLRIGNEFKLVGGSAFTGETLHFWENPWDVNRLSYKNIISPWHYEVRLNVHLVNDTINASKNNVD